MRNISALLFDCRFVLDRWSRTMEAIYCNHGYRYHSSHCCDRDPCALLHTDPEEEFRSLGENCKFPIFVVSRFFIL